MWSLQDLIKAGAIATMVIASSVPISAMAQEDPSGASPEITSRSKQSQHAEFLLRACQPSLAERIGSRVLINTGMLTSYFVSPTEQGLRGQGTVALAGSDRPFEFDCQVHTREGVQRIDYRHTNDNQSIIALVNTPESGCLHLRLGPGMHHRSTTCLADGRSITLNGQYSGDWAQLINGRWAYRPYLRIPSTN